MAPHMGLQAPHFSCFLSELVFQTSYGRIVFTIYITLVGSGKEKASGLGSQYGWCYRLSGERKLQGLIGRILLGQLCLNRTADVVHAPKSCLFPGVNKMEGAPLRVGS